MVNQKLTLLAILILGLFVRAINIQNNPPALYGDELTIGLDANSLLKTGHDQLGNFLPLTFQMGAGRPAGYVYGSIPFIALFGPTALGVRALSILSGIGIIILLYIICKGIFNERIALSAALVAALSPWDINLSRGGFEAHFALFLALLGAYFFIQAKQRSLFYIFSGLSFGLALHTYPTYKLSLLLFLPLIIWFRQSLKDLNRYFFIGGVIFILLGFLSFSQTFIGGSETRFLNINIFSQNKIRDSMEQKVNFERTITNLPPFFSRLFHNKSEEFAKVFIENYLQNFSVDFLFLHGDRNPRHNMATMGQIYLVEGILIFIGFLSILAKNKKMASFLILWLLLSPVATALIDLPHGLRSSFMLPPLIILSALGFEIIQNKKNKVLWFLLGLIFIIQFTFFIQKLYFLAPNEYSNFWSYSAKVAADLAITNRNKFKYIILSDKIDSIEFAYPVYNQIDPSLVIAQNKEKLKLGNYNLKKFENVYIGYIPDREVNNFVETLDGSALFIGSFDAIKYLQNYETIEGMTGIPILAAKKIYK